MASLGDMDSKSYVFAFTTPALNPLILSHLWGDDGDSDSDEEEYFQEGYEESFIDDDEGVSGGLGSDNDPITPPSDHEVEEDEVIEIDSPAVVRQRSHQVAIVISSDEEGDDYADPDTHGGYGQPWIEEEDEDGVYHDAHSNSDHRGDDYLSDDGFWS